MTYSIIAVEEDGTAGVAVQTAFLAVGAAVPWAEQGVGAIATQAMTNTSFGRDGLVAIRDGAAAPDVVAALVEADPERESRQVAMVDAAGRAGAFTGSECLAHCGHVFDAGVSCQGNILTTDLTWEAMLRAYRDAAGPLEDRLLAALVAAEEAGGDQRGRQSAALLVARGDTRIDLRIDDHDDPVAELHRLLGRHRGTTMFTDAIDRALQGDLAGAVDDLKSAQVAYGAQRREPDAVRATLLAVLGQTDEAALVLADAAAFQPGAVEYFRRVAIARAGLDAATVDAVVEAATRR